MISKIDLLTSSLASSLRLWRGTWGDSTARTPAKMLVLFDREDDAECRLVRETLTGLNFDAMIYPCPAGGTRFTARRHKLAPGNDSGPLLHDPNLDITLAGADAIISYLFSEYLGKAAPFALSASGLNLLGSQLATLVRSPLGIAARASIRPKKTLRLYSFESSPFSRPVRELLCALELPYHLVNLGKLQWAEMGPATMRLLALGGYTPTAGSKREHFFQQHGNVQVPFLEDPNHDVMMFESKAIVDYLERGYAK